MEGGTQTISLDAKQPIVIHAGTRIGERAIISDSYTVPDPQISPRFEPAGFDGVSEEFRTRAPDLPSIAMDAHARSLLAPLLQVPVSA